MRLLITFIAFSLLGGWILLQFGFDSVVIDGMYELFNIKITTKGYYLIFGALGFIKSIINEIRVKTNNLKGG